ncbi:hypothetical protein BDZ97DRAFT_181147 [Flammula alnicola]|nr:hypothetical protein BDZ97DRAFT_181147 [Flammula alnicola]
MAENTDLAKYLEVTLRPNSKIRVDSKCSLRLASLRFGGNTRKECLLPIDLTSLIGAGAVSWQLVLCTFAVLITKIPVCPPTLPEQYPPGFANAWHLRLSHRPQCTGQEITVSRRERDGWYTDCCCISASSRAFTNKPTMVKLFLLQTRLGSFP